jgi:hypothetical protein
MEGIRRIAYLAEEDVFELCYFPKFIPLEQIFEKIEALGEERNLPYKSFIQYTPCT